MGGNLAFRHRAHQNIGLGESAVRIVFKPLLAGVVAFKPDTGGPFLFPHPDNAEVMARRQRNFSAAGGLQFARPHVGITGRRCKWRFAPCRQKLDAPVPRRPGQIGDAVDRASVHINGMVDVRGKQRRRY